MDREQFDLVVMGAGSGGVRAARVAAQRGLKVAIAEHSRVGGTCVIRGCVPKKLLMHASQFHDQWQDARGFGWQLDELPRHDWPALVAAVAAEVSRLEVVYRQLLGAADVELIDGAARLVSPGVVQVAGREIVAPRIIVATGARPQRPAVPGAELAITSDDCFSLPQRPPRLLVVGGGFIALEFAGIFRRLGSQVVVAHRGALPLRGFDEDVRQHLANELAASGLDTRWGSQPLAIERVASGALRVSLAHGNDHTDEEFDAVLVATGRQPATAGVGLTEAGVRLGAAGEVLVDEHSRTSVGGIWAVGDCTNRMNLTPVAIVEGRALMDTLFGGAPHAVDLSLVPSAVFMLPPLASVGPTETALRAEGQPFKVFETDFRPMKQAFIGGSERTRMKLLVHATTDRVLAVHMAGSDAPEIVQSLAVALTAGATKAHFDRTIAMHPTAADDFVLMREPSRSFPEAQ